MMLVPLTATATDDAAPITSAKVVGGKASSLAKLYSISALRHNVPKSYALSTSFFQPWMDVLKSTDDYAQITSATHQSDGIADNEPSFEEACRKLKQACHTIPLNIPQSQTLVELSNLIATQFNHALASVRSSAIEEDGSVQSYAGMFETRLGVTSVRLELAVRECFSSKFDARVFCYASTNKETVVPDNDDSTSTDTADGFALVVMEMVDSIVAGVAFSANPLNSDRDECVVDSSFGLGESVVDGSVTADRFIYDKVQCKLVDKVIGKKNVERRLNLVEGGGLRTINIDDMQRQTCCSLSNEQLEEVVRLTCLVEKEYAMPMDVEWAYNDNSQLLLLQARPITTLFSLDDVMMTSPGEKRMLYYDFNIASEATTTTPFSRMDLSLYCQITNALFNSIELKWPVDPKMPMFNASTRQYLNLSLFFKFISPQYCARESILLDPYLSSLFASKDCNRKRYRMKKLPKGVNMRNLFWFLRRLPLMKVHRSGKAWKKNPLKQKEIYLKVLEKDMAKLDALKRRGFNRDEGLQKYSCELFQSLMPSIDQEMGLMVLLGTFRDLDKKRREGKTEEIRSEYDALLGGYEGDELMQMNIDMFTLANKLGPEIWGQYSHDDLNLLAERIQMNIDGTLADLPSDFLNGWVTFIESNGWDGEDQLFISSPRYQDDHLLLLTRLRPNVGPGIEDPAIAQKQKAERRRQVMKLHEERAASRRFAHPFTLRRTRKLNALLEHALWIRNSPKLHLAKLVGILRLAVLEVEDEFIRKQRLESKGQIFHLDLEEVDRALQDETIDLIPLVRPSQARYEAALQATECPLLIDSRCRILRPDPPDKGSKIGLLVGAAVSPGVATGRLRIMKSPHDKFDQGEILAATITSPAWTAIFSGAAAVILQIGGALQHGALCAREMGKPGVSNIDIHNLLKTGMMVKVDGNAGTIEILDTS